MVEIHACTIIARNYLPAARVLAKSFTEHNPGCAFTTLIVDDTKFEVDVATEPFEVLRLDEIGIDHDEALRMAAIYDVSELCTAVKPWLLQRLLDDGAPVVVYLDPDIKVYAPLDKIGHLATETGIVLTPHVTRPMPRDGLSKSETEVLWSGIYNLGFIAVSEQAQDFLDFWKERLKRDCISDPENMRFVDQRWVDFAPGLYPVHILRDTSYNVAYWNLDHRNVVFRENRYLVDGNPLHFFHFSGYSPNTPYLLSKHQGHRPRILLSDRPDLARLCDEYGADLLAHGYGEGAGTEYAFNRLPNGIALDLPMRRLHRSALLAAESAGTTLPPNPLEPGGDEEFLAWVTGPAEEPPGTRLSRYLRAVYERRQDVQRVFPDPDGVNFQGFATWVHHEVEAGRIEPRLGMLPVPEPRTRVRLETARQLERLRHRLTAVPVPGTGDERVRLNLAGSVQLVERELAKLPVPHSAERARLNLTSTLGRLERRLVAVPVPGTSDERVRLNASRVLGRVQRRLTAVPDAQEAKNVPSPAAANEQEMSPGIRVAGYLRTESGVGQLGRLAVAAAESAGLTTSTYVDITALSRQAHPFESSSANLDVNLVCVNADELSNFAKRVGPDFFRGHYTIGMWAWELEEFPSRFAAAFDYVDEVWSISRFASKAIAGVSAKPVHTFPIPILQPNSSAASKADLGLPSGFIFLFYFDLLSIFERKNPLGLVRAFSQAFRPGEGPVLVIKAVNGQFETGSLERLKLAAADRPDIMILDSYLDPGTNAALMASCDCYVSLHRSEGFGLTLAEAMALGKPVIATGYSGNMDFMTPDTSLLVPWTPSTVPLGCSPYPVGARWAEPDLDAAARMMRQVYENPSEARQMGQRAQAHVLSDHGVDVSARFVAKRFDEAQRQLSAKQERLTRREGADPDGPSLVDVVQLRPPLDAPSKHPRAARAFRRVVWRILQSHDDYARALHVRLAAGVEASLAGVARVSKEVDRLDKELSTGLREDVKQLSQALESQAEKINDVQQQSHALVSQVEQIGEVKQLSHAVESQVEKIGITSQAALDSQSRAEELESQSLSRMEAVTNLLLEQRPVLDSDHRLHDTLLRRLAAIERQVRQPEGGSASEQRDVSAIAREVSDFLGVQSPDDPEATTINIGTVQLEMPAWDTVILPWVRQYGEWEPAVGKAMQDFVTAGAVVVDVGAHVGIFTLPLSTLVGSNGRVIAVEADPINARFLRRNVLKSRCDNVMVLEAAALEQTGPAKLSRSIEDNTGDARAYDIPGAAQVLVVQGLALDDVVGGPVSLVKLDIQGTDHVAMRGMSRIINEYHPVIITEFWPEAIRDYGDAPERVLSWFRELGYSWHALEAPEVTDALSDEEVCARAESSSAGYFDLMLRAE